MKRVIWALVLSAGSLCAQQRYSSTTLSATGTTPTQKVDANYHTVAVIPSGSPSGCSVRLEGSLDATNWFDVSGAQSCASGSTMFHVDMKPLDFIRVNLTTLSGGTSPSVVIEYKGQN
jgi:hypothetical protein